MPKLDNSYTIEAFQDHGRGRIWRIDWFGSVDLNPLTESEPIIEVALAPLNESEVNPDKINSTKSYDYSHRRVVWVGVGLLPCLPIGTLWRNGFQLNPVSYVLETFEELLISQKTSRITDVCSDPQLISPRHYPTVSTFDRAKFLVIEYKKKGSL